MEERQESESVKRVSMRRVLLDVGAPSVAHHVSWLRSGSEILLEIGYVDQRAIFEQRESGGPLELEWFVTNRFTFTRDHADRLADVFGQLAKMLQTLAGDDDDDENNARE